MTVEVYQVPAVQAVRLGHYALKGMHDFRPYYSQEGGNGNFLYYRGVLKKWMVGYTVGGESGGLRSDPDLGQASEQPALANITFDHWDQAWVSSPTRVRCIGQERGSEIHSVSERTEL